MNLKEKTVVIDNKTYCYSKVVMLPHNNIYTKITMYHDGNFNHSQLSLNTDKLQYHTNQHLYFLSTDKICEGDWFYTGKYIRKCEKDSCGSLGFNSFDGAAFLWIQPNFKKVISSTNTSLNLPKPSDSFLQVYIDTYNKNEKIEECLVEYVNPASILYKGDTPKTTKGEITIRKVKDSWSREEIMQLFIKFKQDFLQPGNAYNEEFNTWISQNL